MNEEQKDDGEKADRQDLLFASMQHMCGRAIIKTMQNREGYLKAILEQSIEDSKDNDDYSAINLVADAVAALKTVECMVFSTLKSILDETGGHAGGVLFLIDTVDYLTKSLLLANGVTTAEELRSIYKEEDVVRAIKIHEMATAEGRIEQTNMDDAAKELKELVRKHRESKDAARV